MAVEHFLGLTNWLKFIEEEGSKALEFRDQEDGNIAVEGVR